MDSISPAVGGRKCLSAALAYTHSCSVQAVEHSRQSFQNFKLTPQASYLLACPTPFEIGESARCRCSGEKAVATGS